MVYQNKKPSFIFLFYLVIFFAFLSSIIVILSSSQSYIVDTWQNYATFDFEQGTETDENGQEVLVNYITTPEQLAGAFQLMNNTAVLADDYKTNAKLTSKTYKLRSHINVSGKSWTPTELPSGYTFDGCYFSISNLKVSSSNTNIGFISINNGTIQNLIFTNLTITNTKTDGTASNTGGVCGQNKGTVKSVTIISGSVSGNTYKGNNDREVGGICGINTGAIYRCFNYATISQGKHFGGIVGMSTSGSIKNCFNHGQIGEPGANQYIRMGGIVGESNGTTIELCQNFGGVYGYHASGSVTISNVSAGGIVGYCYNAVIKCANYGTVTGGNVYYADNSNIGGIIGCYSGSVSIDSCYNIANISGYAKKIESNPIGFKKNTALDRSREYIGGYNRNGTTSMYTTINRYYCSISSEFKVYNTPAYVGGIIGYSNNKITVSNSYSIGNIIGGSCDYSQIYTIKLTEEDADNPNTIYKTDSRKFNVGIYYLNTHAVCGNANFSESSCYYSGSIRNQDDIDYSHDYKVDPQFVDEWPQNKAPLLSDEWAVYDSGNKWVKQIKLTVSSNSLILTKIYCGIDIISRNPQWSWDDVIYCYILSPNYDYRRYLSTSSYTKSVSLGSAFAQSANKNNGYHYLKDMYW